VSFRTLGAILVTSCAPILLSGCAFNPDPTEATFYVRVTNDTPQAVVVIECGTGDGACNGRRYGPVRLNPGETLFDVQSSVGALNAELITSPRGKRLGCLPVYFDYEPVGVTVNVSEMVPCQKTYPVRKANT